LDKINKRRMIINGQWKRICFESYK
jgi:hypothetical protein